MLSIMVIIYIIHNIIKLFTVYNSTKEKSGVDNFFQFIKLGDRYALNILDYILITN